MPPTKSDKTVAEVFEEFLADQRERLSKKTYRNYENVIELYRHYLEGYWPGHEQEEYDRITGAGGTFCGTFGPGEIIGGYGEFLGYFMPHKVMCGKELMKAAGTVTKKLAEWLAEKGYAKDTSAAVAQASDAAKNLPAAQDVRRLLDDYVAANAPDDEEYEDEIQDHFWVDKIQPGRLWLEAFTMHEGVIGPIPVPKEVTEICGEMWDISGSVVKTSQGWRFLEVWNVSP
jgi:hypothetical protein